MSTILSHLNSTSLVLGYVVMILLLVGLACFIAIRLDIYRYNLRRKRRRDIELDNQHSAWIFDSSNQRTDTVEAPAIDLSLLDTDNLDFTPEDIIYYQRRPQRDTSYPDQDR